MRTEIMYYTIDKIFLPHVGPMNTHPVLAPSKYKLLPIFLAEFGSRFSYWGVQSILVLYFINHLSLSKSTAFQLHGIFIALTYVFSLVGGRFADQVYGSHKIIKLAIAILMLGNIGFALPHLVPIYITIALIAIGSGMFMPNNANFLGRFYENNDDNQSVFTWLYFCTNVGGISGPILFGIASVYWSIQGCFVLSSLILVVCFIAMSRLKEPGALLSKKSNNRLTANFILLSFIIILPILFMLLRNHTSVLLIVLAILTLISLKKGLSQLSREHKSQLLVIFIMMALCCIFFAFEFQVNNSLLVFINDHINRTLGHFTIPTSVFASIEPLAVVMLSPVCAIIWSRLNKAGVQFPSFMKITCSFLFMFIGFWVYAQTTQWILISSEKISSIWMLVGGFAMGAGELFIMPVVIAYITQSDLKQFKATLIGLLYMVLSFSGVLSAMIANLTVSETVSNESKLQSNLALQSYHHTFSLVSLMCLILAISIFVIFSSYKVYTRSSYRKVQVKL